MTYQDLCDKIDDLQHELDQLEKACVALNSTVSVALKSNQTGHSIYNIRPGSGIAGRLAEDLGREYTKVENHRTRLLNHKDRIDDMLDATDKL